MKTSILVTGVTGSGKSTTCKVLRKLGFSAWDLETVAGLYELVDERTGKTIPGSLEQIRDGVDWRCNKAKLEDLIGSGTNKLTFYCGGMSNTEEVWDIFDKIVVLTVSDATTVKRLSVRKNGEFGSIKENRDWTISWKQDFEQRLLKLGGIFVSAEDEPKMVAELVVKAAQ